MVGPLIRPIIINYGKITKAVSLTYFFLLLLLLIDHNVVTAPIEYYIKPNTFFL